MKIEAGKYYRTRGGEKAYVAGCTPFLSVFDRGYWAGFIEGYGAASWQKDGGVDPHCPSLRDISSAWREPVKGEAWALLKDSEVYGVHLEARIITDNDKYNGFQRIRIRYEEIPE